MVQVLLVIGVFLLWLAFAIWALTLAYHMLTHPEGRRFNIGARIALIPELLHKTSQTLRTRTMGTLARRSAGLGCVALIAATVLVFWGSL
jgi:hypothetical protein